MKIYINAASDPFSNADMGDKVTSIELCCSSMWEVISKHTIIVCTNYIKIDRFVNLKFCPNCGKEIEFIYNN